MLETGPLTLRIADDGDGAALRRLAELDSRPLPPGPHLVAEREGQIDAALSLSCGDTVADPFRRTAELCELLRHHAASRGRAPNRRGARPHPRPILEGA
jgi:hypothetical protein